MIDLPFFVAVKAWEEGAPIDTYFHNGGGSSLVSAVSIISS